MVLTWKYKSWQHVLCKNLHAIIHGDSEEIVIHKQYTCIKNTMGKFAFGLCCPIQIGSQLDKEAYGTDMKLKAMATCTV